MIQDFLNLGLFYWWPRKHTALYKMLLDVNGSSSRSQALGNTRPKFCLVTGSGENLSQPTKQNCLVLAEWKWEKGA